MPLDKEAMSERPVILITLGDPCGIGPEVVAKALARPEAFDLCRPLVIGNTTALAQGIETARVALGVHTVQEPTGVLGNPGTIDLLDPHNLNPQEITLGAVCPPAGQAAMEWVLLAGRLCMKGEAAGMVTAPLNKEATRLAGFEEIGHMEALQRLSGASDVATMLMSGRLRVVHLSTHRSLERALELVTKENILAKLELTFHTFQRWGFASPRIGVAALNPHASDGGLLGTEEKEQISPAVAEARARGIDAHGPVPADIVFTQALQGRFDVVLAMYHDQGHIPVKVHGFERSISITLGLPFVRTSVDHGTAFDIAGKGLADPQSLEEALRVAAVLTRTGHLPIE